MVSVVKGNVEIVQKLPNNAHAKQYSTLTLLNTQEVHKTHCILPM